MTATINIQKLWDQKYRDESVPFPIDGAATLAQAAVPASGGDDWATLQTAFTAGGRVTLSGQYQISKPLEWLNGSTYLESDNTRLTMISCHSSWASTDHQMIRNWAASDWTVGETDHRKAPNHIAVHNLYPRTQGTLTLNPNGHSNVACFSWCSPQETSNVQDLICVGGAGSDTNLGTWGLDFQTNSESSFNGLRVKNVVFYGYGWERQLSLDGQVGGGSDVYIDGVIFSPVTVYHSGLFVARVWDVTIQNFHCEPQIDAGAHAFVYLLSPRGFTLQDGSIDDFSVTNTRPFLVQEHLGSQSLGEPPPTLRSILVAVLPSSLFTGNFVEDTYNSWSLTQVGSLAVSDGITYIHEYDGSRLSFLTWAQVQQTYHFSVPTIPGLTDVQVNASYLDFPTGHTTVAPGYSTPDAANLDLTTGCDLRILVDVPNPTIAAPIIGKWASGQLSYLFELNGAGLPQFSYTANGSTEHDLVGAVAVSAGKQWVRVVADATGGGVTTATFYTSVDGATWTTLGSPVTGAVGPFFSGSAPATVGMFGDTSGFFNGKIYRAEVRNLAGTLVGLFDATNLGVGSASYADTFGHTWTAGANAHTKLDKLVNVSNIAPGANGQAVMTTSGASGWSSIYVPHVGAATPTGGVSGEIRVGTGKIWVNDAGTWKSAVVA